MFMVPVPEISDDFGLTLRGWGVSLLGNTIYLNVILLCASLP